MVHDFDSIDSHGLTIGSPIRSDLERHLGVGLPSREPRGLGYPVAAASAGSVVDRL